MGVAFTSADESPGSTLPGNMGQDVGFTITQVWRRTTDQVMSACCCKASLLHTVPKTRGHAVPRRTTGPHGEAAGWVRRQRDTEMWTGVFTVGRNGSGKQVQQLQHGLV